MILTLDIYGSNIDMSNIMEEYFFVITRVHDKILYRFERVGIVIDEDIIGFVITDDISNNSLSEALSELGDNTHQIDSKILNSFRNKLNRDIIGISSDDLDTCGSFHFFDIFSECFCDVLEILSTFLGI